MAAVVVTNVYIDGFNLYYRALKKSPEHKWLNPRALCELLLTRNEIQRIRYFTALVSARPGDPSNLRVSRRISARSRLSRVSQCISARSRRTRCERG